MAAFQQASHHVAAHATKPDHADFHDSILSGEYVSSPSSHGNFIAERGQCQCHGLAYEADMRCLRDAAGHPVRTPDMPRMAARAICTVLADMAD
jgi:hypothetical protein